MSISTGIRAHSSIAYRPTSPAWYEVPQATITIRRMPASSSSDSSVSARSTRSPGVRSAIVSATASGCSWISFSMKVS